MVIEVKDKKFCVKSSVIITTLVSVIVFTFIFGYCLGEKNQEIVIDVTEQNEEYVESVETIQIYITGCVINPGIYEIEKGSILNDIILKAGGFTQDACEKINLVYKIYENVMINIKSKTEINEDKSAIEYDTSQGEAQIVSEDGDKYGGLVNINTANVDELCTLPGIGQSTAEKIIAYRQENGRYNTIEEIMNITGIKESRFESIKDYISVK